MSKMGSRTPLLLTLALCLLAAACSDGSNKLATPVEEPPSEAQQLLDQFGTGAPWFTTNTLQALLDYDDRTAPVTLLQLIAVTDPETFAAYEDAILPVWESVGATPLFASEITAQILGERPLQAVRAIEFPSVLLFLDALRHPDFTTVIDQLFAASNDHAWVLGPRTALPPPPNVAYIDFALRNLDRNAALNLLAANSGGGASQTQASNPEVIIDMLVSDDPSPFWMVNLIDYYDQAQYPDGSGGDLTGAEANEIYGRAILPTLLRHQSLPALAMDISLVLTANERAWESAAIVRYASRDAFLNSFALNPGSPEALKHKAAAVENTLVYVSESEFGKPDALFIDKMHLFRYCEVLLASLVNGALQAEVWNTQALGNCPQEDWEALDAGAIAAEYSALAALLNGPRFWVVDAQEIRSSATLDRITDGTAEPPRLFGDIPMALAATVQIAAGAAGQPGHYQVNRVSRNTVWHYDAGREVYVLVDPQGNRYIMQSFSRIADAGLELEELAGLGNRLSLPEGWQFYSEVLEAPLQVPSVDGVADVVQDDLSNTYQWVP
jgi:uncharacterized protein (DUF1330 family)